MRIARALAAAPALAVALLPLAAPAPAAADFQEIFNDYRTDGELNRCYRPEELHEAAGQIPPDIEQYAPGFGDALAGAQSRCTSGASPPPAEEDEQPAPAVSAGTPGPGTRAAVTKKAVREPPSPRASRASIVGNVASPDVGTAAASAANDLPGALVALLVAAAIALALALAWTLAWFMGWSPERLTKPLFAAFQTAWDRLIPGR